MAEKFQEIRFQREERGFGRRNTSLHARSQEKKDQFLLLLPSPTFGSARSQEHQQCSGQTRPWLHCGFPCCTPSPAAIVRSLWQPPQQAVTAFLPSSSDGTVNVPTTAMPLARPRGAGPPAPLNFHIPTAPGTSPAPTAMKGRKQVPGRKRGAEAACPNTPKEIQILNGTVLSHQGSVLATSVGETQTAMN